MLIGTKHYTSIGRPIVESAKVSIHYFLKFSYKGICYYWIIMF